MTNSIEFVDTTLRDAPQSLWATRMTTAMMLPAARRLARSGVRSIDLIGQPQFDACVRYLKEDPWLRIRLVREQVGDVPLRGWMRSRGFSFSDIVADDVNALWIERQIANGVGAITSFDGLNDIDNIAWMLRHAKQLGAEAIGAIAYSVSPAHTDELYVSMAKGLVEKGNVDAVLLKDSGGLLTVDRIRTLVPAIKRVIGDTPLELHSHCTIALAPLVYMEGVKCGVHRIHTSVAPLANGVAQPSTQSMVRNLRHSGWNAPLDMTEIEAVGEYFARVAEQEGLPVGRPLEYDPTHYDHQMPGGMLSNYEASLKEAGMADRLDELLVECGRVRGELGWPMLITPFAQIVGAQALLNIMTGERYGTVPDPVKRYALGYWGKLLAPIDPDVLDRIVERGSKEIALTPTPRESMLPNLRRLYPKASDDELLLRTLFGGSQVDAMLSADQVCTDYVFGSPVLDLLKSLAKQHKGGSIRYRNENLSIEINTRRQSAPKPVN